MTKKQDRSLSQDYHKWAETIMCFGCGEAIDLDDDGHVCDYYDTDYGLMCSDCEVKVVYYLCFNKKNKKGDRMIECNAIIEANNEIDKLKRENEKLNELCVKYGFEMRRLEEENERLKKENKFLQCTIESNSQDDYIDYLEKQNERLKERIEELVSHDKIVFMNG